LVRINTSPSQTAQQLARQGQSINLLFVDQPPPSSRAPCHYSCGEGEADATLRVLNA